MLRVTLALSTICLLISCSLQKQKPVDLATGIWRATLTIQGQEVPFSLEVVKDSTGGYDGYIHNADERLLLDEVTVDRDSIRIPLHIFDASIRGVVVENMIRGSFIKHYEKDYRVPFIAEHGLEERFMPFKKRSASTATVDFSGKYRVRFFEQDDTVDAVGIFSQSGDIVTGTFLTPTGDYRFLEGDAFDDSLRLSTFDGNYVYLFKAKQDGDTLRGRFYSGKTKNIVWTAVKDDNAPPPNAESITYLREGYDRIDFTFPDINGKPVSLNNPKYKDKVIILQIFGTWCPNCMDETKFLAPWYDKNKDRGVEIIGLAYERKADFNYASARVKKMVEKFDVNYDFVIAGVNDKDEASKTLPMLNRIAAFPTTIFINKDGKVAKIHSGFSGPGTGIYYEQFIQDFNETVNSLLAEDRKAPRSEKL